MKRVLCLSGGADSTSLLLLCRERNIYIDEIVFWDGGREYPIIYEQIAKLIKEGNEKFTVIKACPNIDYYWDKYGVPKPEFKWRPCTRDKVADLRRFTKQFDECLIGYDYGERFTRAKYRYNQRYPLLEMGVCKEEAIKYCEANGYLFDGLYKVFRSVGCVDCPMVSKRRVDGIGALYDLK